MGLAGLNEATVQSGPLEQARIRSPIAKFNAFKP